ncbi:MAG TPA: methyltransferase domain-containing protein [Terriglobales bacterium]|nr:methyltransferase domain-containing protein [Terriglobales bacterium]
MAQGEEENVHRQVQEQFGATAAAYTFSAGHGDRAALQALVAMASVKPDFVVLDIATGAGHTALAFAPHVREVVAYDLTPAMLLETANNAAKRGLVNVATRQGSAETLPFADGEFDVTVVRLASHHFADNQQAVREMARVTRRGGRAMIVDNYGPEDPALDAQLQHIEKLRDPSHVRSYRLSVWRETVREAGLKLQREVTDRYSESPRGMSFRDWVRRSKTPPAGVEGLHRIFSSASVALRELLKIEPDGDDFWFTLPQVTLVCER